MSERHEHDSREEIISSQQNDQPKDSSESEAKLGFSMLTKVTLGIVIIVSLIISISCLMQYNQNQQLVDDLKEDIAQRNEQIKEIQRILNSQEDEEYIIEQAKEKFNMYFPDEEIIHQDVND